MDKLKRTTWRKIAKDNPKDRIEVEVGDSKQPDFKPQVKLMRWDNEVNFSIRAEEKRGASIIEDRGVLKYISEDYEVHQYEKEVGQDGGFEFEWVLNSKPKSNILRATIQSKELDFFYQPSLTQEEIERGSRRPENVVGSYAVYHKTKRGNIENGKEYKVGKAFHIYRPKAIDSEGKERWCNLNIDGGLLTVTVPEDFLNTAVYPVVVDPTFGYTSQGASLGEIYNSNWGTSAKASIATLSVDGTISSFSGYFQYEAGPAAKARMAIYTNNSGVPLDRQGYSDEVSTTSLSPELLTGNSAGGSFSLSAGTYWLAAFGNHSDTGPGQQVFVSYDTGGTDSSDMGTDLDIPVYNPPETPWTEHQSNTFLYSIYATYTASASDLSVSVSDQLNITESRTLSEVSFVSTSDQVNITESNLAGQVFSVNVSDSIGVTSNNNPDDTYAEEITIRENISIEFELSSYYYVSTSDQLSITEFTQIENLSFINVSDSVSIVGVIITCYSN